MVQKTVAIEERQVEFVEAYANYGFHNSDELIAKALDLLQEELQRAQSLVASAALHAELYETDVEAQEWEATAAKDWN